MPADLVFAAANAETLREIGSWDGFRPATFAASDFPVDVVRFERSSSPPVVVSRARRADTLKALPVGLRDRALAAFARFEGPSRFLALPAGRRLDLSKAPIVMGVVNVTPDSFSDAGLYLDPRRAAARALEMFEGGAAIVDVGANPLGRPATGTRRRSRPRKRSNASCRLSRQFAGKPGGRSRSTPGRRR